MQKGFFLARHLMVFLATAAIVGVLSFIAFRVLPSTPSSQAVQPLGETILATTTIAHYNAYPIPEIPTPTASPLPPTTVPSPTPFPTAISKLPPGPKLIYGALQDSRLVVWAASAEDPTLRQMIGVSTQPVSGFTAAVAPDQSHIAFTLRATTGGGRHMAELWLLHIESGEFRKITTQVHAERYLNYPVWSPDNTYLAIIRQSSETIPYKRSIVVVNLQSGAESTVLESQINAVADEGNGLLYPLGWSRDSSTLYYQRGAYSEVELRKLDIHNKDDVRVASIAEKGIPRCYFVSPDGNNVLCLVPDDRGQARFSLVTIAVTTGQHTVLLTDIPDEGFSDPLWSPDSASVAIGVSDPITHALSTKVIDVQTKQAVALSSAPSHAKLPSAWSPDGRWLVGVSLGEASPEFTLMSVDGKTVREFVADSTITIIGWTMSVWVYEISSNRPAGYY